MRGWWRCPLCGAMVRPMERPSHLEQRHKGELASMKNKDAKALERSAKEGNDAGQK